jgi:dTMP kinase
VNPGRFITFEGIDGAGKSTLAASLGQWLRAQGIEALCTREPGGTELAESLRELVLTREMDATTETLLVFAARADHLALVIQPALAAGRWVICDRFTDASFAYQGGGRGVPTESLRALEHLVHPGLQPALTVLVDLDPEAAAVRLRSVRLPDRFERQPVAFFRAVRAAYRARVASAPGRYLVLDGRATPEALLSQLCAQLAPWLGSHG